MFQTPVPKEVPGDIQRWSPRCGSRKRGGDREHPKAKLARALGRRTLAVEILKAAQNEV